MAGSYKGLSDQQIQKRIKEGRGQGEGRSYKPWIQTWDISSLGRSHRIFGNRSRRLHHLLSDLELAIFLTLDWQHSVLDIREQFPLRVEDTTRLADELGISHAVFNGTPQVLSSDFLVTFDRQTQPLMALLFQEVNFGFERKLVIELSNDLNRSDLSRLAQRNGFLHLAFISINHVLFVKFKNVNQVGSCRWTTKNSNN